MPIYKPQDQAYLAKLLGISFWGCCSRILFGWIGSQLFDLAAVIKPDQFIRLGIKDLDLRGREWL